jgi:Protein of unknown function (DUF3618)
MGEDPRTIRQDIERTRSEMGDTVEALGYKTDVKTRTKEAVSGKLDSAKGGAGRAKGAAEQNPLGLAIGGLAVGFLGGLLIPGTRVEDEKIGPVADQVKEKGQEALERGKDVAQQAAESAKETARDAGQEHADQMRSGAGTGAV